MKKISPYSIGAGDSCSFNTERERVEESSHSEKRGFRPLLRLPRILLDKIVAELGCVF